MSDINKIKKEIYSIDNDKEKLMSAMRDIEEAKSFGEMMKAELDNLKALQFSGIKKNQEVITWNAFDSIFPPIGKLVLIQTKNGTVLMDSLMEDSKTGETKFTVGNPKTDVIYWADRPKGIKEG